MGVEKTATDEYDFDSSDEEDIRNTVGNIPLNWYANKQHIGYDTSGKKLLKPDKKDELDSFLQKMDDPDFWRTIEDPQTGQDVKLSETHLDFIRRLVRGRPTQGTAETMNEEWLEWFTAEKEITPLSAHPPVKASFMPSKSDKIKVSRLVHAMKMGWVKIRTPAQRKKDHAKFSRTRIDDAEDEEEKEKEPVYDLWENEDLEDSKLLRHHIRPPKKPAPGHAESYNPAPEYLLTQEEEETWKAAEPYERRLDFIPKKYPCLRRVPAYPELSRELSERCYDLYLAPRLMRERVNISSQDLLPELPPLNQLRPYPEVFAAVLRGHVGRVLCLAVSPDGSMVASGGEDGTLRVWDVSIGGGGCAVLKTVALGDRVVACGWRPAESLCRSAVAAAHGNKVTVVPVTGALERGEGEAKEDENGGIVWSDNDPAQGALTIGHSHSVLCVSWHPRGDFLAVGLSGGKYLLVHRLSTRSSQTPLSKLTAGPSAVSFHPSKPVLMIADNRHVRCFDLVKQLRTSILKTNCRTISDLAVHSSGDHVLVSSFDGRAVWFDLDLSSAAPYKSLSAGGASVRSVALHPRLPLCALGADDANISVYHARVYTDLLHNPLLLPVRTLRGHQRHPEDGLGVQALGFSPTDATLFSCAGDGTLRLAYAALH